MDRAAPDAAKSSKCHVALSSEPGFATGEKHWVRSVG